MVKLNKGKGELPLYIQIKQIIKDKILNGDLNYGDLIPAEIVYQQEYGVSRITIRQAIIDLENEGLVERKRGKGTSVIYQEIIEEDLTRVMSFTNELIQRGMIPGCKKAHVEIVKAGDVLADIFNINLNRELYYINRVRTADGQPVVLFKTYLINDHKMPMNDNEYKGSLYELMNKSGEETLTYNKEKIEATLATKELAEALEIKEKSAVLKRTRIGYNKDKKVIEYTLSFYPANRYSYIISDVK
jgi:GntR family transcriptional regulator